MSYYPDYSDDDFDDDYFTYNDYNEKKNSLEYKPSEEELHAIKIKKMYSDLSRPNYQDALQEYDNGENINLNLGDGWTAIMIAASNGNPDLLAELIKRGADVNSSKDGFTILMMASNCPELTAPYAESFKAVKLLVENGADVIAIDRKRMNAAMYAANSGNLESLKYLLKLCDPNCEDNQKWDVLFWAVNGNHKDCVLYLIEYGIDFRKTDIRKNTPLDLAKYNDLEEIVDLFPDDEPFLKSPTLYHIPSETLEDIKSPKFLFDMFNMVYGMKSISLTEILLAKNFGLKEFLTLTDQELKDLGVVMPFQRNRILNGLYKFHQRFYRPKSIKAVPPANVIYTNMDACVQLVCAIKQILAMEASLIYIMKNSDIENEIPEEKIETYLESVKNIKSKVKTMIPLVRKIIKNSKDWDQINKPADLIKPKCKKVPWMKVVVSISIASFVIYKFCRKSVSIFEL